MNPPGSWRLCAPAAIVGAWTVAASSCDDDALPTEPNEGTVGPLTVELRVEPVSVPPEGETTATILIRSSLDRDTTISSSSGCIAFLQARRGGEEIGLTGVGFPCVASPRGFTVPAEGVFRESHRITATLTGDPPRPAPRGLYTLEADFNVTGIPTLRHRLEIQ